MGAAALALRESLGVRSAPVIGHERAGDQAAQPSPPATHTHLAHGAQLAACGCATRGVRRAACGVRRVCSPRQAIKLFTVAYAKSATSECKQVRAKPLALTDAGLPRPLHVGEGRRARRFHRSRTSHAAWRASHIGYARPAGLPSTRRRRGRRRGAAGGDVGRGRLKLAWDRSQPIPLTQRCGVMRRDAVWGGAMQPGGSHLARTAAH